jgi:hypothetical protein
LVYTFDTQSNTWSIPTNIDRVNTAKKISLTGIIDYNSNSRMYLYGGYIETNPKNFNSVNDMLILDTINFSWGKGSLFNAAPSRSGYGAVLLPDNNIIYMGKKVALVVFKQFSFFFLKKKIYYLGGYDIENIRELELDKVRKFLIIDIINLKLINYLLI